jgi:hypothetical protein
MELGSSFLFLQEQIKDIIIITVKPRGFGWRIHCGVEVTVPVNNTLSRR